MDIYGTDDSIWSQTETTTDRQDHSIGSDYQEMAATDTTESFIKELNVKVENILSAFNISSYIGTCSDILNYTYINFQYLPYEEENLNHLIRKVTLMFIDFITFVKTTSKFLCTNNTTLGNDLIYMSQEYSMKIIGVLSRVYTIAEEAGDKALARTIVNLYDTFTGHVKFVNLLIGNVNNIISEEEQIYVIRRNTLQQVAAVNFFSETSELETIVRKQKELVSLLENISKRSRELSEYTEIKPFMTVITSSEISGLFDPQYWAKLLEQENHILDTYEAGKVELHQQQCMRYYVHPMIITVVLVVGMTGNGLLLTIFVRHKEMRTLPNSMLINLTVVDFLSLVVNVLLDHLRVTTRWQIDWLGCQIYFFFSYLLFAVSTYTVAMISVQRFVAVMQLPSITWCHQSKKIKYVLIATVWCLGFILSVPHAVAAYNKTENCEEISLEYLVPMYRADLITFCVLPLLITAVFSGLTAYRMRRSVLEIPGEVTGQEQLKHSRMVSSNVLVGLTILFVVSYAPFFFFKFLIFVVGISKTFWEYLLVNTITYYLRFTNCCLNPIVLFVMSKRFRGYIKRYCGQWESKRYRGYNKGYCGQWESKRYRGYIKGYCEQKKVQLACNSGGNIETPL
jgi:hypothetical protein